MLQVHAHDVNGAQAQVQFPEFNATQSDIHPLEKHNEEDMNGRVNEKEDSLFFFPGTKKKRRKEKLKHNKKKKV